MFGVDSQLVADGTYYAIELVAPHQPRRPGFRTLELVATMPGEPLYLALGVTVIERFELALGAAVRVPVARMDRAM